MGDGSCDGFFIIMLHSLAHARVGFELLPHELLHLSRGESVEVGEAEDLSVFISRG